MSVYYYEILIKNLKMNKSEISIGFAEKNHAQTKHPGYSLTSYGFKQNGKVVNNKQLI